MIQSTKACPKCGGKGRIIKSPCTDCNGMGRVRYTRKLNISVPAGIDDGQTFVLQGEGDHGVNGPEGTQPGTVFRLRNKGIQYVNARGRGDQYVKVTIEVPTNLNAKQKEALREFDSHSSEKNYNKRKSFFDKLRDAVKGEES